MTSVCVTSLKLRMGKEQVRKMIEMTKSSRVNLRANLAVENELRRTVDRSHEKQCATSVAYSCDLE